MYKLKTEELVSLCYKSLRKNLEIYIYLTSTRGFNSYINNDILLYHWRFLTMKDFYIQVNNLITVRKNRKTKQFEYQGIIIDALNEAKISVIKKERLKKKIIKKKNTIIYIRNVRDKFYAHIDCDYKTFVSKPTTLEDYERISFLIQDLIQKIYGTKKLKEILKEIPSRNEYKLIERLMSNTPN